MKEERRRGLISWEATGSSGKRSRAAATSRGERSRSGRKCRKNMCGLLSADGVLSAAKGID